MAWWATPSAIRLAATFCDGMSDPGGMMAPVATAWVALEASRRPVSAATCAEAAASASGVTSSCMRKRPPYFSLTLLIALSPTRPDQAGGKFAGTIRTGRRYRRQKTRATGFQHAHIAPQHRYRALLTWRKHSVCRGGQLHVTGIVVSGGQDESTPGR